MMDTTNLHNKISKENIKGHYYFYYFQSNLDYDSQIKKNTNLLVSSNNDLSYVENKHHTYQSTEISDTINQIFKKKFEIYDKINAWISKGKIKGKIHPIINYNKIEKSVYWKIVENIYSTNYNFSILFYISNFVVEIL